LVRLAEASLVAGKVVPDAPARPRGVPAATLAELVPVVARSWPAWETERSGSWLLRAAGGWTRRANSAVPLRPDETPDPAEVVAWYAARGLRPAVQVTTGAGEGGGELLAAELERRGWAASGHSSVRVGALAPLADREPDARVRIGHVPDAAWLAGYRRAAEDPAAARRVLAGEGAPGVTVLFATVPGDAPDRPAAVGRCAVDGRWAGFAAIGVDAAHRRRGLATAVMAELARAALAAGASAAHLQVEADNAAARALYDGLGFFDHHHYHYRTAPPGGR
jgi:ribosomal protein S18 acetylase RimI-like enzyme